MSTRINQANNTAAVSLYEIAIFYTELDNKDQAFFWLDTAYRERDIQMLSLKTYFALGPLRSDPRFADLVTKVELPQ
jgi:PIN domain nuclease of toxin-antitoxin system